ncbi:MAG TPA: lipopolysaccharide kinase InaA family protein, partial [Tepidisphaeraceae bacterium]|nr:lipopolysaccharide kinase InaA family protein [Tepidisphaeraceae bacterium]
HDASMRELEGQRALEAAQIPTLEIVAYGRLSGGRGFIISNDLARYEASDKVIKSPEDFDRLLIPTADLAAKLHNAGLHHRDLYLCHFFAKVDGGNVDVRLIDTARVKRLPGVLTRQRWIVKDLGQFWYSTFALPIDDAQRDKWLARYVESRGIKPSPRLKNSILRKANWIARHDRKLVKDQPDRNISIPGS